jgi:tetratricopeptide (TPR) repeat protein
VPQAACFVVPRDETFAQFRRHRRAGASAWALLETREAATVFLPSDVAPQETRDCLHEEIAQALGPLNDLYRLPDSVFNDDNFHTVLTGFDMLILRATYSRELASGMSETEVARRLPALLSRLNPRGRRGGGRVHVESRPWIEAVEEALSPRASVGQRRAAAARALALAQSAGWRDPRLAFSHFTLGRVALAREYGLAIGSYLEAARLYNRPGSEIQAAHVAMQFAAFALSAGRAEEAIAIADRHAPVALRAENASLLATFLLVKAEALDMLGRDDEARAVRLDSLGWARYGFGSEAEVRMRVHEIAVLRPRAGSG